MRIVPFLLAALIAGLAGCVHDVKLAGYAQPHAKLQVGGQPSAEQLRAFAAGGGVVIDLRGPDEARSFDEAALAAELGLRYVNLPVSGAADLTPARAESLHAALAAASGPVLLHCASGNRAGALLALEAARYEGLDAEAAIALGRSVGLKSLEPAVRERLGAQARP
ncbi:MAG: beta-lactamase hydrolase domain-containing protein [Dokdonella sp.]|uniref:beta-lactamase hydrolase domain-containing protein n=1 Tax=Dokdonella sp. TaxID=2291710 RepID=UPI003F7E8466